MPQIVARAIGDAFGVSASRTSGRFRRALGFQELESRLAPSVAWSAGDGVFSWLDSSGSTQAFDVAHGQIEVHFVDDVANAGDITEIVLLQNNAGFAVTTAKIDVIDSNGHHLGDISLGVDVGVYAADADGALGRLVVDGHVTGDVFINGSVDEIHVSGHLLQDLTVTGSVGVVDVGMKIHGDVTVEGDLDQIAAANGIHGVITVREALGEFSLADANLLYASDFHCQTLVIYNGATKQLTIDCGCDDDHDAESAYRCAPPCAETDLDVVGYANALLETENAGAIVEGSTTSSLGARESAPAPVSSGVGADIGSAVALSADPHRQGGSGSSAGTTGPTPAGIDGAANVDPGAVGSPASTGPDGAVADPNPRPQSNAAEVSSPQTVNGAPDDGRALTPRLIDSLLETDRVATFTLAEVLQSELFSLHQPWPSERSVEAVDRAIVASVAALFSAGYAIYASRVHSLLALSATSAPLWREFDPLALFEERGERAMRRAVGASRKQGSGLALLLGK